MKRTQQRIVRRTRRKHGIRKRMLGTPGRPRLTVFRSAKHIYAQVVDDLSGMTLVAASTNEKAGNSAAGGNVAAAKQVGKSLADRARSAGIEAVVFDRNGYRYHGRIKALAESAREAGLKF